MSTKFKVIAVVICLAILLAGCSILTAAQNIVDNQNTSGLTSDTESSDTESSVSTSGADGMGISIDLTEYFSSRDYEVGYDEDNSSFIVLNGDSASCEDSCVTIEGTTITITEEGTYILSGTLNDGMIIVDTEDQDAKVQIVLNGVSITSSTSAAIYVKNADKVFITTAAETENTLSNDGVFTAIDENNIDAVIFSKSDLTLNGEGSLTVASPAGHGIVSKDDLNIASGTYSIDCAGSAICANDGVYIGNGTFTLTAGKDGIHAENSEDGTLGNVYIGSGTFTITAGSDGICGYGAVLIEDGTFTISSSEGIEGTLVQIDDGTISIQASDDGINATNKSSSYSVEIIVNGGTITVNMGAGDTDGFDANGSIFINGGTINVSCNSAFDYNIEAQLNGGTVYVNGEQITTIQNSMMGGGQMPMGNGRHNP